MVFRYTPRRLGEAKEQQVECEVARRCGFCVAAARIIVYHSDCGDFRPPPPPAGEIHRPLSLYDYNKPVALISSGGRGVASGSGFYFGKERGCMILVSFPRFGERLF